MSDTDAIDLALLLFRCGIGLVMLAHGYNHVWGGGKIAGTARWFGSMGMRPPVAQAWLASITELGAGAALVAGLLTPLGGAGVVGTMAVAWAINHRGNGFFIFRPGEGSLRPNSSLVLKNGRRACGICNVSSRVCDQRDTVVRDEESCRRRRRNSWSVRPRSRSKEEAPT